MTCLARAATATTRRASGRIPPTSTTSITTRKRTHQQSKLLSTNVARNSALSANRISLHNQQKRHEHAISNPTLANIEKRWEEMPPQEQAELWMALRDRMTVDWKHMTMQEKRASYWVAFGPHGPRARPPPGEGWYIFKTCSMYLAASVAIFLTLRYFARPAPKTMSEEWQAMSNEYLKAQGTEAITGVSSEGYTGKGMIQSPKRGPIKSDEDDE